MVSLLVFLLSILMTQLVTRVGVIALEITGLSEEQAEFQAVSAISGAGIGSQEAELTIRHPARRKVITNLMNYGSAGVITTIAALAGTFVSSPQLFKKLRNTVEVAGIALPLPIIFLVILALGIYGFYVFLSRPAVSRLIQELVTQVLVKGHVVESVQYEEFTTCANGYGVTHVEVCERNPMYGKTLAQCNLAEKNIQILNVDKLARSVLKPDNDYRVDVGDRMICFGPMDRIQSACYPPVRKKIVSDPILLADEPLVIGSVAPNFILPDHTGELFELASFRGQKNVVLIFYPKDRSFTCSSQLKRFGNQMKELEPLDIVVAAVNQGSMKSHAEFADDIDVDYPILSDADKKVCRDYKALMLGELLINRTVYAIDKQGKICYAKRGNPPLGMVIRSVTANS